MSAEPVKVSNYWLINSSCLIHSMFATSEKTRQDLQGPNQIRVFSDSNCRPAAARTCSLRNTLRRFRPILMVLRKQRIHRTNQSHKLFGFGVVEIFDKIWRWSYEVGCRCKPRKRLGKDKPHRPTTLSISFCFAALLPGRIRSARPSSGVQSAEPSQKTSGSSFGSFCLRNVWKCLRNVWKGGFLDVFLLRPSWLSLFSSTGPCFLDVSWAFAWAYIGAQDGMMIFVAVAFWMTSVWKGVLASLC